MNQKGCIKQSNADHDDNDRNTDAAKHSDMMLNLTYAAKDMNIKYYVPYITMQNIFLCHLFNAYFKLLGCLTFYKKENDY